MFGVAAVIAKLLLWRVANPPAFFAGLGAFVTATALWRWLMPPPRTVTIVRGAVVGAAIRLLAPAVTWLLFGLNLLLSDPKPPEALGWTFAYAMATLALVAALSVPVGALLGAALGAMARASAR